MAFNKRTWKGRQGTGLNKFSIDGATPVTVVNQPDSITEQGDALSAGNLNDLENRINNAFEEIADGTQVVGKATADASGNVITDTYETKAEASDLNDALTQLDHRVENLEQAHGSYEVKNYKDGSITPSGKGNWAVVEGLRGVSRVENQIADIADGSSGTGNTIGTHFTTYQSSHFYLFALRATFPSQPTSGGGSASPSTPIYLGLWNNALTSFQRHPFPYQSSGNYAFVGSGASLDGNLADGSSAKVVLQTFPNSGELCTFGDVILTDLNIYFGTSDLSFLGATDSAKLATIQQNYPFLLEYSDYDAGSIVDTEYGGVKSVGVNIWDEEWEVGSYSSTGQKVATQGGRIRSVNKIPALPNTSYYALKGVFILCQYDENEDFISFTQLGIDSSSNVGHSFTTESNTHYLTFATYANYGTTYNHDIQICLNSYTDKTIYHPYMENTLSLTFQGKSAGSVADTDELNVEVDGVERRRQTRRVGQVDGGTLDWQAGSTDTSGKNRFTASLPIAISQNSTIVANILCTKYIALSPLQTYKCVTGVSNNSNNSQIIVYDESYAEKPASEFKEHVTGVIFNYELADPIVTLSDPLLDNTLLTESGGRMATVQTGTVVDGSFDMGFINL